MKLYKSFFTAIFIVLLSLSNGIDLFAQRVPKYVQLARKNQRRPVSFNQIMLPDDADSTTSLATVFNIPYSYLPFKKNSGQSHRQPFYSEVQLSMEVFESDKSKLGKNKDTSVEGLPSAARTVWSDTAFATDYEQSQSTDKFISGYVSASLSPDIYSYVLQIKQGQKTESQKSHIRTLQMPDYSKLKVGNVILGEQVIQRQNTSQLVLSKFGNNVEYASDFYALVYLPNYHQESSYSLSLTKLNVQDEDTSKVGTAFSTEINGDRIKQRIKPALESSDSGRVQLSLQQVSNGYTYALLKIPGSQLPNALYRLSVKATKFQRPVAQTVFQTVWPEIPNSLLSLDVAIDMLRFITDEQTVDRLSSGSKKERKQKFRDYWKQRDPSPETEYNELMTEYYNRIDYAFENFSTKQRLGYQTDQGEVYIKFGKPDDIDRKFPTEGATTEVWSYPSRKFIFKATSGFGNFQLVEQSKK